MKAVRMIFNPDIQNEHWKHLISNLGHVLARINSHSKIAILYGADADGFVSYLFLKKILEHYGANVKFQESCLTYQYTFDEFLEKTDEANWEVICLDVPAIQEMERFETQYPNSNFIFIDHHLFRGTINQTKTLTYINPVFEKIDVVQRTPVCIILYYILMELAIVTKNDEFMLAVGLQGDSALRDFPKLMETLRVRYKFSSFKTAPLKSPVGILTKAITSAFQLNPGLKTIPQIESSYESGDMYSLTKSTLFVEIIEDFDNAVKHEVTRARKNGTRMGYFFYYGLSGNEFVSNIVCRRLSIENKQLICVIEFRTDKFSQFEFRYSGHSDVNIPELLVELQASKLTVSFGGHPTAAGAIVLSEQRTEFLEKLGESSNGQ